jgi:quercetin dioxygenase-like cupin family protein
MASVGAGFVEEMQAAGLPTSVWENEAGHVYGTHTHAYNKILCCLEGSITFRTPDGEVCLGEGDRLVLEAGRAHSAVVGSSGVRCAEAHVIDEA